MIQHSLEYEKQILRNKLIKTCTICQGEGWFVDKVTNEGVHCSCVKEYNYQAKVLEHIPPQFRYQDLNNFKDTENPAYKNIKAYIENINTKKASGRWIYLSGDNAEGEPKKGKTLLAISVLKGALRNGYSIKFCTVSDILDADKSNDFEFKNEFKNSFKRANFIVIDAFDSLVHNTESAKLWIAGRVMYYLETIQRGNNICIFTSKDILDVLSTSGKREFFEAGFLIKQKADEFILH